MALALLLSVVMAAGPAGAEPAPAPPAKKVAVLPFETAGGVDESVARTMAGALLGEIRRQRGDSVNLMAPDDVVAALPGPLRSRLKRCTTATCKAQMASAVSADRALSGSVSKVGSTVVLNLALLEAANGAQVTQWTGKASEAAVDKLLDDLPKAAAELFPPPPQPSSSPQQGVPGHAAADASAPGAVTDEPVPAGPPPMVTPLLPPEDLLGGAEPGGSPPGGAPVMAAPAPEPPSSPGAKPQEEEGRGFSVPFAVASVGVGVPAVTVALVMAVVSAALLSGGVAAHVAAFNINREVKSVPHKETTNRYDYDLGMLILTGRALEGGAYAAYGVAGIGAVLLSMILLAGVSMGVGLMVAAMPRPASSSKPRASSAQGAVR